jgi:hypothetical protein
MADPTLINITEAEAIYGLRNAAKSFNGTMDVTLTPYTLLEADASGKIKTGTIGFPGSVTYGGSGFLDANMKANGEPSIGTAANLFVDHVHPVDPTKADLASPTFTGALTTPKVRLTPEGGIAVKMTNKSGSTITKGRIIEPYSATGGFRLAQIESWNPIGVVYDDSIANDADGWVVISGIAEVYYSVSSTIGNVARVGMTADTGEVAGEAMSDGSPTNDAVHFREIGHPIQTRADAGLALTILHFN